MKKAVFALVLVVIMTSLAHASIEESKDSFKGNSSVSSQYEGGFPIPKFNDFSLIYLSKKFDSNNDHEVVMTIIIDSNKYWFFSRDGVDLKIDGNITRVGNAITKNDRAGSSVLSASILTLDEDVISSISSSNSIILRAYFNNMPDITWEVPAATVQEWKKVINATKPK